MLEGTPFQHFGRWVKHHKQKGFREFDSDKQGTIDIDELEVSQALFTATAYSAIRVLTGVGPALHVGTRCTGTK